MREDHRERLRFIQKTNIYIHRQKQIFPFQTIFYYQKIQNALCFN